MSLLLGSWGKSMGASCVHVEVPDFSGCVYTGTSILLNLGKVCMHLWVNTVRRYTGLLRCFEYKCIAKLSRSHRETEDYS